MRNATLKFVCRQQGLRVASSNSPFTAGYNAGAPVTIPIAHHDGNYAADAELVARLKGEDRIAFTYEDGNPNGSVADIAGILSENRRVLGMMPHPERAVEAAQGNQDGAPLFSSLISAFETA
jgi:phosphoribosylformylglycinamidine synthase